MVEQLLVRFSDSRQEKLEWLCIGEPQRQPESGMWQELAEAAKNKAIILLLPASAVLLLEIELPVKSNVQLKKALPFALEDLLADDVESYHLVWLRQAQDKLAVAAVAHEKLAACIGFFREIGLELEGIYPESLCLPYQLRSCSIMIDRDQAILRTGQWQGGGIDAQFLPQFLRKLRDDGFDCPIMHVKASHVQADLSLEGVEEPIPTPLHIFADGFKDVAELNLLSGPYAPKHKADGSWRQWLPALAIMLLALTIQLGVLLNQNRQQQTQLSDLESKTLELFKQTFPDIKRIVNVKAQADQQLVELKKQGSHVGSGFMRMLYLSGELLKDNPALRLRRLNFVNAGLQMQLNANDIGQLEQFKQSLPVNLQVKIQSADSGENGVEAQLEIREK